MSTQTNTIRLSQFSKGAGCGCKVAPQVLKDILIASGHNKNDSRLLVGHESSDDAAAYDLGNGTALISTTDFFTPVVDDPYDFGRAAAANSISDVYAMGGKPLLALAILGWPVEKLPATMASKVIEGARSICSEAGITLAGGHTVDLPEPFFGLAVSGLCDISELKKNNTAKAGDLLYLTKPLGTGLFTTAQKKDKLLKEDEVLLIEQLCTLNKIGEQLGKFDFVTAMTDVTGFGLLGHLLEMAEGSGLRAEISYSAIPKMLHFERYLSTVPDATYRNWNACEQKVEIDPEVNMMEAFLTLPDPQTNGGLLIAVNPEGKKECEEILKKNGLHQYITPIGTLKSSEGRIIRVIR